MPLFRILLPLIIDIFDSASADTQTLERTRTHLPHETRKALDDPLPFPVSERDSGQVGAQNLVEGAAENPELIRKKFGNQCAFRLWRALF